MSIPLHQEPKSTSEFFRETERCCFCRVPTVLWTLIPERTPGEQVACCKECGETHEPAEVPTKREWCKKERSLTPHTGRGR